MSSHGRKGPTGRERRRQAKRELGLAAPSVPAGFTWANDETDVYAGEDPLEDPLAELREMTELRRQMREVEPELVDAAREAGVSWSEIGAALGMSAQGARQRRGRP